MPFLSRLAPALCLALALPSSGCVGKRRPKDQQVRKETKAGDDKVAGAVVPEGVAGIITGERLKVEVAADDAAKGASEPLVTIVEYSDFQCPFCSKLAHALDEVATAHPQDVRLVFKQFPLPMHADAEPGARAAVAAGRQDKFWEMHDQLFANQRAMTGPDLERFAGAIGLDVAKWKADLADPAIQAKVNAEANAGKVLEVSSTPTFFVNGRMFKGAMEAAGIKDIVAEEIRMANQLIAAGVARGQVYETIMGVAKPGAGTAPPPSAEPNHKRGEASRVPNYAVPLGDKRPQKGPDDALVTIVEFNAFDCDDCQSIQPALTKIVEKWGDDVRLVFRQAPTAETASQGLARAGAAAHRQGKFWELHDKLFELPTNDLDAVKAAAKDAGLDVDALVTAMKDPAVIEEIKQDTAHLDNFRGTTPVPIVFVNGRYLDGVPTFEEIDALVAEEKGKAETCITEQGLSRGAGLYEEMRRKCAQGKPWRGFDKIEGRAPAGGAAPSGDPVEVTLDEGMPVKGDPKAKVTIVECSDFDCPFCQRGAEVVDQVAEKYGDKVAIYFRQFPLAMHPNAEIAHKAALAAHRQGKFWEMHDKLFANKAARTNAELSGFAQEIGLDVSKFETDLADPELTKIIERDKAACTKLGVSGTPTFYVNGVQVRGAQPLEAFSTTIDAALAG